MKQLPRGKPLVEITPCNECDGDVILSTSQERNEITLHKKQKDLNYNMCLTLLSETIWLVLVGSCDSVSLAPVIQFQG